jgi:regulator of sigma E protease
MFTVLAIVVSIVGLGFLILAHEFGHFVVAKLAGMRVEEFSLGFGRFLVSKRIGETVYGISALPLGGYVRVTGMHKEEFEARVAEAEEEEAEDPVRRQNRAADRRAGRRPQDPEDRLAGPRTLTAREVAATPPSRRYYNHPTWHKILFIVAGVTMNVIVAFFLLVGGGARGYDVPEPTISEVSAGSAAAAAGLVVGDRFVSIDGKQVASWEDVQLQIRLNPGKTVVIVVDRAGRIVQVNATIGNQNGAGFLGVAPSFRHVNGGVRSAFGYGARTTGSIFWLTIKGFGLLFAGRVPVTGSQGLAGPVGIISLSTEAVQGGYYLNLLALISINLAIVNMIPLLPLDGGHVLMSIIERIRGRSLSLRTFERVSLVGLGLFAILFLVATSNDIGRIFGR